MLMETAVTKLPASPPLPDLEWSKEDNAWECRVHLPAWEGTLRCDGPYGASDRQASTGMTTVAIVSAVPEPAAPSEAQARAFAFHREHGAEVVTAALKGLWPWYQRLRPAWASTYPAELLRDIMPELAAATELHSRIGLHRMWVHPWSRGGVAYVGLELGCSWDEEHGAGLLMLGTEVVAVGAAEISFAYEPPSTDDPAPEEIVTG